MKSNTKDVPEGVTFHAVALRCQGSAWDVPNKAGSGALWSRLLTVLSLKATISSRPRVLSATARHFLFQSHAALLTTGNAASGEYVPVVGISHNTVYEVSQMKIVYIHRCAAIILIFTYTKGGKTPFSFQL